MGVSFKGSCCMLGYFVRESVPSPISAHQAEAAKRRADLEKQKDELRAIEEAKTEKSREIKSFSVVPMITMMSS